MTRDTLIRAHAARWGFRVRGPFEGLEAYATAAADYLERYDWAAAFEVRLGKQQAEWTPEEVAAFVAHVERPRPDRTERAIVQPFADFGPAPCTLAGLRTCAGYAVTVLEVKRLAHARAELPIILQVITLEGRNLVTIVHSDDRIAVLRGAARTYALYAYALTFDAYVHNADGQTASKSDALLTHLGTRDGDRHILQRRYTVDDGGRVTMQPETDLDCREVTTPEGARCRVTDPYAWVFVSVPTPARPQ